MISASLLSRPLRALCCGAAAFVLLGAASRVAHANDIGDELTLGEIKSSQSTTPFVSDLVEGAVDVSDQVSLDLDLGITHYGQTKQSKPGDIFQLGLGGSWFPNEHWALDAHGFVSPQSVSVEKGVQFTPANSTPTTPATPPKGTLRDKASALGFSLGGEYDTAGDSNAESAVGLSAGVNNYSTTQRVRLGRQVAFGKPENASLLQWHLLASFTETLFDDTDLGISGTYYLYNRDPNQSGYYGETIFGRVGLGDGIPLQPLRFALRPSIVHRFGPLHLRGYWQYGQYMADGDFSLVWGLKGQLKLSKMVRTWLTGNAQRDYLSAGNLWILSVSLGARLLF